MFIRAKAKRIEAFRCSATIQKTRVFYDQGAHNNWRRHDRMSWHNNSMPLQEALDPYEGKGFRRNGYGTKSCDLNQYSCKVSFTSFDRPGFQLQIGRKQTQFIVNKLNTLRTDVITYQPNNCDWVTSPKNSRSICKDDQEYFFDKDSRSIIIAESSLGFDDELVKLFLKCHTLPCLQPDDFLN